MAMVATRSWSYCRKQSSSRFRDYWNFFLPPNTESIISHFGRGGQSPHQADLQSRIWRTRSKAHCLQPLNHFSFSSNSSGALRIL